MADQLVIHEKHLLGLGGESVKNFKKGDGLTTNLVNLFFLIFNEDENIVAIDANSSKNRNININFTWVNGSTTCLSVREDHETKLQ
jgi:hypothetical protein